MSSVRALAALLVLVAACGPGEWKPPSLADSHEDPAKVRPGFGNDALHAWWPLTEPELSALQNVDEARQGDAHALLALAILGSGDVRDAASYARYAKRFDDFVESVRPTLEAEPDQAKRGDLLNRAMHKVFFTGAPNPKEPSIGSYDYDQPRVTGIFEHGTYNCISSALLYTALARAFGLPVRGVITKNHAFVELDPDGTDQRIDVETTDPAGFGQVHDAAFYARALPMWKKLGLDPMTYDDYLKREVLAPYVFVARAMNDKRSVNAGNEDRIFEAAGLVAPEERDPAYNRLASYANEAKSLHEKKDSRTVVRLLEVIAPTVSEAAARFSSDPKIMTLVEEIAWFDAEALEIVGRGDEAVAIAGDGLDHVQPTWTEAKNLQQAFTSVLLDHMTELQAKGDYEKSVEAIRKHIDACRSNDACLNNLYLTFDGWCVKAQLAKDWAAAKKVMQVCISLLPDDTRCHHTLDGLNEQHPG